jgi:superfamily II DNA or RNA helicase
MYRTATDLRTALSDVDLARAVVVEEAPDFSGELLFQVLDNEQGFYQRYQDWMSRYLVLNELSNLDAFIRQLDEDGFTVIFGPSAEPILARHEKWREPLEVGGGFSLHPYQSYALRRAFDQGYWFFNWSAGAGKSFCCALGAKLLFDQNEIDLVLAFTLSKLKIDLHRRFVAAGMDAVINDGTRARRERVYYEDHQVYVANYEKAWVDEDYLAGITAGKRVLWIFDECHKIVSDGSPNKARKALDRMIKMADSRVWPMSASVVGGNPLRYRDVFSLDGRPRDNPLDSKADFVERYADKVSRFDVKTRTGGTFQVTNYDWNLNRLQEVRHRVGDRTQAVRKTDPGVREAFKGLQTVLDSVQLSDSEAELTQIITTRAAAAHERGETLMPYYRLLRYACNTPAALMHTTDEIGLEIAADHPSLVRDVMCTKLEMLNDKLESIREAGDKVVVFTHWTNLTLHLIKNKLVVPHVIHYGVGQSDKESQAAQDRFKADPDITCFLTSDAGSHGLNMQCARYVIQYEPLYSYDDAMQRASRIDRSDSHLDGLTNYVMVTEDSVEQRVWDIQQQRREISSAIQGTAEVLSYRGGRSETDNLAYLIFGQ